MAITEIFSVIGQGLIFIFLKINAAMLLKFLYDFLGIL